MQKVTALIGNLFMNYGYTQFLFMPITAALLPFEKFSLCLRQSFPILSQEIWIISVILIRSDIKTMHGKIQPKKSLRYYGEYLVFILHQNTYVVFPGWCLAYSHSFYGAILHQWTMQTQFNPAYFWQLDPVSLDSYRAVLVVGRIGSMSCLLRAFCVGLALMLPIAKEVIEGLVQIHLG